MKRCKNKSNWGECCFVAFLCLFSLLLLVSQTYINCSLLFEAKIFVVALFWILVVMRFVALVVYCKMLDFFVVDLKAYTKLYN